MKTGWGVGWWAEKQAWGWLRNFQTGLQLFLYMRRDWEVLGAGRGEGQGWSEEGERRVRGEDRRMK